MEKVIIVERIWKVILPDNTMNSKCKMEPMVMSRLRRMILTTMSMTTVMAKTEKSDKKQALPMT